MPSCLLACAFIQEPYLFMFVWGLGIGTSTGFGQLPSMLSCWKWFPYKKGTVTGITSIAFSLGPTIYALMFTFISNPDNKAPDVKVDRGSDDEKLFGKSVSDNVEWSFIAFAIVSAVVGIAGVLLMHEREMPELKDLPKEFRSNMTLK